MLTWDAQIDLYKGPCKEVLLRELGLAILPSPVWNIPSRQDAACTHFLINQQWFCCFRLPALLQGASSVGWGPPRVETGVEQRGKR